jgi:deazaflavin-dependent oxidoreductase (nitroreductase family)
MNQVRRVFNSIGARFLVRSGRAGILGTTGAKTGRPRRAGIGFVRRDDGSLLLGAGSREPRGWTANLRANPSCTFEIRGVSRRYTARPVGPGERPAALAELAARLGSSARRADWGELFVLDPEA